MHFIRERVLSGYIMAGAWCNLCSSLTVEMATICGYDWVLIDQEHGPGDNENLLHQIQALGNYNTAAIVRIAWKEMFFFKRALDLGASGIMIPYVESVKDAKHVVSAMRYAPEGTRGIASSHRAASFGQNFNNYRKIANKSLTTIVQIETEEALKNLDFIAKVDGVDVLFVGPLDLSNNLGLEKSFGNPVFEKTIKNIAKVAKENGKAAGILIPNDKWMENIINIGYTFIAIGTDGGYVSERMKNNLKKINKYRTL